MNHEGASFESSSPIVEIEQGYENFVPQAFRDDPFGYVEREGANVKGGEVKRDESGRVREDPTAVKYLPAWQDREGRELHTVAKFVNAEKAMVGESGNPLYEYNVIRMVRAVGLPASHPIAHAEQGGRYLFIMERVPGYRWSKAAENELRRKGYAPEDIERLKREAAQKMLELKGMYEGAGIQRSWKLADLIFEIDDTTRRITNVTPVDWERTRFEKTFF